MSLEMIRYDENGQAFIDFESLEMVTSKDFVDRLRDYLSEGVTKYVFDVHIDDDTVVLHLYCIKDSVRVFNEFFYNRKYNFLMHEYLTQFGLKKFKELEGKLDA